MGSSQHTDQRAIALGEGREIQIQSARRVRLAKLVRRRRQPASEQTGAKEGDILTHAAVQQPRRLAHPGHRAAHQLHAVAPRASVTVANIIVAVAAVTCVTSATAAITSIATAATVRRASLATQPSELSRKRCQQCALPATDGANDGAQSAPRQL